MNFWEQFWPQFWGGIASGLTLAALTALITFLTRKRILRTLERHIRFTHNHLSSGSDSTDQEPQS